MGEKKKLKTRLIKHTANKKITTEQKQREKQYEEGLVRVCTVRLEVCMKRRLKREARYTHTHTRSL